MIEKEEYTILRQIIGDTAIDLPEERLNNYIPLFSFEGLPGAGKTTQIKRISESIPHLKPCCIDIPTPSPIGVFLKSLYSDQTAWATLSKSYPWLNPYLVSLDLKHSLISAQQNGAQLALMSRGILSTYYYNLNNYLLKGISFSEAWDKLSAVLENFPRPTAVFFLDLPSRVAHTRIIQRNRLPFRDMDKEEVMVRDLQSFKEYISKITPPLTVHTIDANAHEQFVTDAITTILSNYVPMNINSTRHE